MMRRTSRLEDGSFFSADRYFPFSFFFSTFFSQTTRQKYVETILVNHDRINAGRIAEVKFSVLDHASGLSKMGLLDIREGSRESSDTKIVMCGFTKNRISDCNDCRFRTFTLFLPHFPSFNPKFYPKFLGTPDWNANYPIHLLHWNISR